MTRFVAYLFFSFTIIAQTFASQNENDKRWSSSMWNPKFKISGEDLQNNNKESAYDNGHTPQQAATTLDKIDFGQMQSFNNINELQEIFSLILGTPIAPDPAGRNVKRRIPWLINTDYCYARAAFAVHILKSMPQFRDKLKTFYVFGGTLQGKKQYIPEDGLRWYYNARGPLTPPQYFSGWSYHVVLAGKLQNQVFILDPSTNFKNILTLEEWLKETVLTPEKTKYSLCSVFSPDPDLLCQSTESALDDYLNRNPNMLKYPLTQELELFSTSFGHLDLNQIYNEYLLGEKHSYWKWPVPLSPPKSEEFQFYPIPTPEEELPNKPQKKVLKFVFKKASWVKVCSKWRWSEPDYSSMGLQSLTLPQVGLSSSKTDYWGFGKLSAAHLFNSFGHVPTFPCEFQYCTHAVPGDEVFVTIPQLAPDSKVQGGITHFLIAP